MKRMQDYVLSEIKKFYNESGRMPGIRELQRKLGYSSPRSISYAYDALVHEGKLFKEDRIYSLKELNEGWKSYEGSKSEIIDFLNENNPLQFQITGSVYFTLFYR